jgi:pilin isopeptide linkage protein
MNKVHQNHGGGTINAFNRSVFTYHIDQDSAVGEQEKTAYVAYAPNNQDVEKNFVGYNADTGELVWYIRANVQSDVSGRAYITEYIPTGQTYSGVNIIVAQKGAWFPKALYVMEEDGTQTQIDASSGAEARLLSMMDSSGNNSSISTYAYSGSWTYSGTTSKITIDYENITQEEWIEDGVTKGTKVTIPLDNVQGASNNGVSPTESNWNNNGRFTIRVNTKLDADELVYLASGANKTYSNTVTFSQPNHLVYGDTKTATGAVTNGSKLVTKSEAAQQGPAYVQYALDINPYGYDLMSGDDPLAVVDIMNTDISLASDKTNYFKVYDVSKADDIYDDEGTVVASKVTANGVDVTDSCYMEDITGTTVNGMATADAGKLTYQFTVPDSTHLVILYWAEAAGVDGDTVDASNKAYFYYNGKLQVNSSGEVSSQVDISDSGSSVFSGPFFKIKKTDQELNPVEGATFAVYQYVDGTNDKLYTTVTTDENGGAYVGHRSGDGLEAMSVANLYYIVETGAPAGYKVDRTPYYFEFKGSTHDTSNDPTGVTINTMKRGGIYTAVNEFKGASYDVPIKKTLNGENIAGTVPFTFTLKPDANNTVTAYTDSRLTTAVPADGLQVTITGSGETTFDSLYFKEAGKYVFTMTEDELSQTAKDKGYSGDGTVYTVTIVVAADATTNAMVIQSATYAANGTTKDITTTDVPTFNNTFGLTGELNLTLHKQLDGDRAKAMQDGEFSFKVSVKNSVGTRVVGVIGADGNVQKDENGKTVPLVFHNDENGDIAIKIPLTEEDVGDITVTVSEIKGEDETIDYTTDTVKAYVTISEIGGGKVGQTGEVTFRDDNSTFVNTYEATGTLRLTGTKSLIRKQSDSTMRVTAGAYDFEVYEGKVKVATGTNDANGNITFTDIVYYSADIGDHTYTVKEVAGNEKNIAYDDTVYTVNVTVADGEQSDGTLTANITGITKQDGTTATAVAFTNYDTTVITPTGLRMDFLPYALAVVVAGSVGATMMLRKWKRRKNVD